MEKIIYRAEARGKAEYGWLSTRYSFSFADWYEPTRMGFGALRVLNDDSVAPSTGFDTHGHKDMEIITIVTSGAVTHKDSLGNEGVVSEGEVQTMSAGTGVLHSEINASKDTPLELFQIWIEPKEKGIAPRYAQRHFGLKDRGVGLTMIVHPDSVTRASEALPIHQNACIYHAALDEKNPISYHFKKTGNGAYIFVISGSLSVGGETLHARDAIGVWQTDELDITSPSSAEALIIEVPMKEN